VIYDALLALPDDVGILYEALVHGEATDLNPEILGNALHAMRMRLRVVAELARRQTDAKAAGTVSDHLAELVLLGDERERQRLQGDIGLRRLLAKYQALRVQQARRVSRRGHLIVGTMLSMDPSRSTGRRRNSPRRTHWVMARCHFEAAVEELDAYLAAFPFVGAPLMARARSGTLELRKTGY
jgi:hypothetical protein